MAESTADKTELKAKGISRNKKKDKINTHGGIFFLKVSIIFHFRQQSMNSIPNKHFRVGEYRHIAYMCKLDKQEVKGIFLWFNFKVRILLNTAPTTQQNSCFVINGGLSAQGSRKRHSLQSPRRHRSSGAESWVREDLTPRLSKQEVPLQLHHLTGIPSHKVYICSVLLLSSFFRLRTIQYLLSTHLPAKLFGTLSQLTRIV